MSKRQINSTFTKQELKCIILEFGQNSCFVKVELICLLLIWIAMKIKNLFYIDNVHEKGSFSQKETIELQKI